MSKSGEENLRALEKRDNSDVLKMEVEDACGQLREVSDEPAKVDMKTKWVGENVNSGDAELEKEIRASVQIGEPAKVQMLSIQVSNSAVDPTPGVHKVKKDDFDFSGRAKVKKLEKVEEVVERV